MMLQWQSCKKEAAGAVLLFRMGDFYEAFYEDAQLLSKELDLTLTKRQGVPMSGVPVHTCDSYVERLVAKGLKVAIAEQMEDPKQTKGLVKREVVRIVTPATLLNASVVGNKENNFFVSIMPVGQLLGLACIDFSTGAFWVCECESERELLSEVSRLQPKEILTSERCYEKHRLFFEELKQTLSFLFTTLPDWHFDKQTTHDFLTEHFKVAHLSGFGLSGMTAAIQAAGALLRYLHDHLSLPISQIDEIHTYSTSHFMAIDRATQRNLELTTPLHSSNKESTLLSVLDHTETPMGGRLLHHWILQPLLSLEAIHARQEGIEALLTMGIDPLMEMLRHVKDLERLMTRITTGYATARDLLALHHSFSPIADLKQILSMAPSAWIQREAVLLDPLPEMNRAIASALVDEPPLRIGEGKTFREGYCKELDELRLIQQDSKAWIAAYQQQLQSETGIRTLKVGYTKMFGYFIEVSQGQTSRVPNTFIRRQTLVNAERYISPALKEFENKILSAEERIDAIEQTLFAALKQEVAHFAKAVFAVSQGIAKIDCLASLAKAAKQNHYTKPLVDAGSLLIIEEGRHPVVEQVRRSEQFIPNDTYLNDNDQRLLLITGPNMAGKSTYLRQTALIAIMAQMGGFVPAKRVHIGLIDKVFCRIGASDDLARGQSTFMVEMTETANILNNATSRSLVILDEIGRGTSTYDGISIAWSVAEYLLTAEGRQAKTLFATHYWELTKLEEKVPGAVNYNVAVAETGEQITFCRKIVRGGTDKSYGIHVAKLAGMPSAVLHRSREILAHLEENANRKSAFEPGRPKRSPAKPKPVSPEQQLVLF